MYGYESELDVPQFRKGLKYTRDTYNVDKKTTNKQIYIMGRNLESP